MTGWRFGVSRLHTFLGLLALLIAAMPANALVIVKDASPIARVITPELAGSVTQFAAEELRYHIEQISGARLALNHAYEPLPRNQDVQIILKPRILERDVQADGTEDIYWLTTVKNTLVIEGNTEHAVLFGVYHLLGDLGVRWYMPGKEGTNLPSLRDITLKTYDGTKQIPSFRSREVDLSDSPAAHFDRNHPEYHQQLQDYALWLMRNRVHFIRTILTNHPPHPFAFNRPREFQNHSIRAVSLGKAKLEEEPERFALVSVPTPEDPTKKVQQRIHRGAQLCLTHPRNIQTAAEAAINYFTQNPGHMTFALGLQDHAGFCECENCTKANNGINPALDPNRVVWSFMNAVAYALAEKYPTRKISLYAPYGNMTHPPEGMKVSFNVVAVAAQVSGNQAPVNDPQNIQAVKYLENIALTRKAGADIGLRLYTMYSGIPQPLALLDSVKPLHELGAQWYHCESMGRDQQRWIVTWVLMQLIWDVNQNPEDLLREFCDNYYGPGGDAVLKTLKLIDARARQQENIVFGSAGFNQILMSEDVITQGSKQLHDAHAKAKGIHKQRLAAMIDTFDMLSQRARLARASYQALNDRKPESVAKAKQAIESFKQMWQERDWGRTCSPVIHRINESLIKAVDEINGPVVTSRGNHMGQATPADLLRELYAPSQPPAQEPAGLTYLPELWKFKLDIYQQGAAEQWYRPDLDDSDWPTLSTWNFFEKQGFVFDGEFWYRTSFNWNPPANTRGRVVLRFGALDDGGRIYLNGKMVFHRHHLQPLDWQQSFEVDVTDAIRPGRNDIAIHGLDAYGAGGLWKPAAVMIKADGQ